MGRYLLNPRRSPRLPARCQVEVSFGCGTWRAETDDIGPRGCRLVSPWPLPTRAPVRLFITSDRLTADLLVLGRVIWGSHAAPFRTGVALAQRVSAGPDPGTWFERLLEVYPDMWAALGRVPERLPLAGVPYLGQPPEHAIDLSDEELALLRLVARGATVDDLQASQGNAESGRVALFALVSHGFITMSREDSVPASRWDEVLAQPRVSRAGAPPEARPDLAPLLTLEDELAHPFATAAGSHLEPVVVQAAPPAPSERAVLLQAAAPSPAPRPRSAQAQTLLDQARTAAAASDVSGAIALLRRALALSPHDLEISALLGQLAFRGRHA